MRVLKKYLPTLATLLLILLGAAMPWLTARTQDARISKLQEKLELNTVSLTLQKDAGVEPALEVVSREFVSVPWENETQLTEREALDAAVKAVQQMGSYDLVPSWEAELLLAEPDGWAEPALVIAEDESTALVWNCYWKASSSMVTVDDTSGKAVRFLVESQSELVDGVNEAKTGGWEVFFQDYYGSELTEELNLNVYQDYVSFNFDR